MIGTTSACAENTGQTARRSSPAGNYLRVRGEYCMISMMVFSNMELPPRARRIPLSSHLEAGRWGTTSACAENTVSASVSSGFTWNYLRVRGEYWTNSSGRKIPWELPPRARRIHGPIPHPTQGFGTTSACAENTLQSLAKVRDRRNYLRVRGEYPK